MLPDQVNNKLIGLFNINGDAAQIQPVMTDDVPEAEWLKINQITEFFI